MLENNYMGEKGRFEFLGGKVKSFLLLRFLAENLPLL